MTSPVHLYVNTTSFNHKTVLFLLSRVLQPGHQGSGKAVKCSLHLLNLLHELTRFVRVLLQTD